MSISTVMLAIVAFAPPGPTPVQLKTYESKSYILETNLPAERAKFIGEVMDAAGKEYDLRFKKFARKFTEKQKLRVYAKEEEFESELIPVMKDPSIEFASGFFNLADGYVYTYDTDGLESVLKHECFHQFVNTTVSWNMPAWSNEGLAEYFEASEYDAKTGRMNLGQLNFSHIRTIKRAKADSALFNINQLLDMTGHKWSENMDKREGDLQYAQTWALCHFIVHGDNGKYQKNFDDYLLQLSYGRSDDASFATAFGADRKPLQKKYDAYLEELITKLPPPKKKDKTPGN